MSVTFIPEIILARVGVDHKNEPDMVYLGVCVTVYCSIIYEMLLMMLMTHPDPLSFSLLSLSSDLIPVTHHLSFSLSHALSSSLSLFTYALHLLSPTSLSHLCMYIDR